MQPDHNVVGWFEIPVRDMQRAITFYETIFGFTLQLHRLGQLEMAWFPAAPQAPGAGGTLIYAPEHYTPSRDGTLVYFSAPSGDLSRELARVEPSGGTVLRQKTLISGEVGYMGLFLDTEGNRIALHSRA